MQDYSDSYCANRGIESFEREAEIVEEENGRQ
jgi:hypothetical protein